MPCPASTPSTPYAMQTESKVCGSCLHTRPKQDLTGFCSGLYVPDIMTLVQYMIKRLFRSQTLGENTCWISQAGQCLPCRLWWCHTWLLRATNQQDACRSVYVQMRNDSMCFAMLAFTSQALDPACSVESAPGLHAVRCHLSLRARLTGQIRLNSMLNNMHQMSRIRE